MLAKRIYIFSLLYTLILLSACTFRPTDADYDLSKAIETSDLNKAKQAIEQGADVNFFADYDHKPKISKAIDLGDIEMVQLLQEHGARLKYDDEEIAELMLTNALAGKCHPGMVKQLLEANPAVDLNKISYIEDYAQSLLREFPPVLIAYVRCDMDIVQTLLDKGARIDYRSKQTETVLKLAIENNQIAPVKHLLAQGANPESPAWHDKTVLAYATEQGHFEIAQALVDAGADIHFKTEFNDDLITMAAKGGNMDMLNYFIAKIATPTYFSEDNKRLDTMFMNAMHKNNSDMIRFLYRKPLSEFRYKWVFCHYLKENNEQMLDYIIKIHPKRLNGECDGRQPLIYAIRENNLASVKYLIKNGADFRSTDGWAGTAFSYVSYVGNVDMVKYFIELAEQQKPEYRFDYTDGLWRAAYNGNEEIANIMLAKGAKITQKIIFAAAKEKPLLIFEHLQTKDPLLYKLDDNGLSLLHYAIAFDNDELMRLLIAKGADINLHSSKGLSPLNYAILKRQYSEARILLEQKRIKMDDATPDGMTALMLAIFVLDDHPQSDRSLITDLLNNGADVNFSSQHGDIKGLTPLMVAAMKAKDMSWGIDSVIELLVAKGADLYAVNSKGLSAAAYLAQTGKKIPGIEQRLSALAGQCDNGDDNKCLAYGNLLLSVDQAEKAQVPLDKLCSKGNMRACQAMGAVKHALKDTGKARHYLSLACEHNNASACSDLGHLLFEIGEYEPAASVLGKQCDKQDTSSCATLGIVYLQLSQFKKSRDVFKNLCRQSTDACLGWAYSERQLGNKKQESVVLNVACKLNNETACRVIQERDDEIWNKVMDQMGLRPAG